MSVSLLTLLILCVCVVLPVVTSQSDVYVFVYLCLLERRSCRSVTRLCIIHVHSMLSHIEHLKKAYAFLCAQFFETYLYINMCHVWGYLLTGRRDFLEFCPHREVARQSTETPGSRI